MKTKVWYLFLRVFWMLLKSLISAREIGHKDVYYHRFEILLIFPDPKSYVVRQLLRQLVYQVCYTRYHVLWLKL